MSEEQADYITDALEMMGISEPRQIVTEVSGFIPVFEVVLHHYKDYMTALVFGRMWQYCGMSDGVCKASLDRIGKDLEINAVTVMRHAEKLVNDGYLIDTTPDRRNAPHEYLDGRKVEMKSRITAGMTINNATVIKSNATVIKSQLIKQDNTNIKKIPLSQKDYDQVNAKVDYILETSRQANTTQAACTVFEAALGFGSLIWDAKPEWRKFAKWVMETHAADSSAFHDYAIWRNGAGKYQAMSNNKIRQSPQMFMDTGWPTFLAHNSMYANQSSSKEFGL